MRRRQLKRSWARLKQLETMSLTRENLLMKLGAARAKAPSAWRLVNVVVAEDAPAFTYRLDRTKCVGARAATCSAPICPGTTPHSCGSSMFNSSKSRRPSKI